jgi:hypothetical protein
LYINFTAIRLNYINYTASCARSISFTAHLSILLQVAYKFKLWQIAQWVAYGYSNIFSLIGAEENSILPGLVEKDYWIMHVLWGLKLQNFQFELKGGTSLSKGYKIIDRFSEDIDIHIKSEASFGINENPKNSNPKNVQARKDFYDWLAQNLKIDGITSINRDHAFDDEIAYRSDGIRLNYQSKTGAIEGVKEGILFQSMGFATMPV